MIAYMAQRRFSTGETMRRREFIALVGASVAWPFAAMAQEPGRTYRIGGLSSGPRNQPNNLAMLDELRRLGFIEGQNLTIVWRSYGLHIDLAPEFAAELVKSKVDVIYASGDAGIRAVQQATATIPILGITQDMVGQGLVKSSDLQCNQLAGCRLTSRREIDYPAVLRSLAVTGCSSIN
jgi:putative ABC transport system substrate-binding protein